MGDERKELEDALTRYADHIRISACADNEYQQHAHMEAAHGEYLTILHMFDAIRAAQQAKVPEGFVLVPVEPTPEMTWAGVREAASTPHNNPYRVYKAMLAATPAPVAPKGDQHGDCLCCCRKHGGRGFTQGCVKCEQERTAAQAQEGK